MGRPSKLTPEVQRRVVAALRSGAFVDHAAQAAGIAPSTYYSWCERGEAGELAFSEFSEAATRARAEARVAAVARIHDASECDWRAAAWFLERSDPAHWGRRTRVDIDDAPVRRIKPPEIPDSHERLVEVARILRDAGALPERHGEDSDSGERGSAS